MRGEPPASPAGLQGPQRAAPNLHPGRSQGHQQDSLCPIPAGVWRGGASRLEGHPGTPKSAFLATGGTSLVWGRSDFWVLGPDPWSRLTGLYQSDSGRSQVHPDLHPRSAGDSSQALGASRRPAVGHLHPPAAPDHERSLTRPKSARPSPSRPPAPPLCRGGHLGLKE